MTTNLAVDVRARLPIIDSIAVADVEARLGAVPPNRVLNEPRKRLRETGIELPGIDPLRHGLYNVGAAASLVAGCTIRMVGVEPCQDAGTDQKVVHQGYRWQSCWRRLHARGAGASGRPAECTTRSWSKPCPRRRRPPGGPITASRNQASRFGPAASALWNCRSIQPTRSASAMSRMNKNNE